MYHIFCIHSSVEGHLGSFQLAVNAGNELVGCLQELAIAREYLYDLERIVRLKAED